MERLFTFEMKNHSWYQKSDLIELTLSTALMNCIRLRIVTDGPDLTISGDKNLQCYALPSLLFSTSQVARMRVPKMVKNGFNSVLQTPAGSRRLVATRNSGTNAKSKTVPKSQKANKNHFRPI